MLQAAVSTTQPLGVVIISTKGNHPASLGSDCQQVIKISITRLSCWQLRQAKPLALCSLFVWCSPIGERYPAWNASESVGVSQPTLPYTHGNTAYTIPATHLAQAAMQIPGSSQPTAGAIWVLPARFGGYMSVQHACAASSLVSAKKQHWRLHAHVDVPGFLG